MVVEETDHVTATQTRTAYPGPSCHTSNTVQFIDCDAGCVKIPDAFVTASGPFDGRWEVDLDGLAPADGEAVWLS